MSYVRGAETGGRIRLYLVSPLLFLLALATREAAVTLPAALLLWELASPGETAERPAVIARRQAAHWAILACAGAAILLHPVYLHILASGFSSAGPGAIPARRRSTARPISCPGWRWRTA